MQPWLKILASIWLAGGFIGAGAVALHMRRHRQKMPIMVPVWIITPLYFGAPGYFLYRWLGCAKWEKPFWTNVITGTLHCGAGCTLGDIIAEFSLFFAGYALFIAELPCDFILAFLLGIIFQYFSIVPMRKLSPGAGILAACQADALSLISFEVGLFGWMALMRYFLFAPPLTPASPVYWFMMQIGMVIGFCTAYPVNWWLLRAGIKEAM